MDGVAVILQLLATDAGVTAIVPETADQEAPRLSGEELAAGVQLPAISVEEISAVDRNIPGPGPRRFVSARIQVTGHARNYAELRRLMRAVKHACADKLPTVAGLINIAVHTDGAGPQGTSPITSARAKTQDFRVTYNEER